MRSQESPIELSGTATAPQIPPQTSIPLYYGFSAGHHLTSVPYAPSMHKANMVYPPPQMVAMHMFQQGHTQPVVSVVGEGTLDPSMNMQEHPLPENQAGITIIMLFKSLIAYHPSS